MNSLFWLVMCFFREDATLVIKNIQCCFFAFRPMVNWFNQWFPSLSSITSHSFLCPIKPNQLAVSCCFFDEKSHGPMSKTASIPISSSCLITWYLGRCIYHKHCRNDLRQNDNGLSCCQGNSGASRRWNKWSLKAQCQPCRKCIPLHM